MKTKYRYSLTVNYDLQFCLSEITPRIDKLRSKKQPIRLIDVSSYNKTLFSVIHLSFCIILPRRMEEKLKQRKIGFREKTDSQMGVSDPKCFGNP